MDIFKHKAAFRKSTGVLLFFLEMNLLGGTIFGFPGIFKTLSRNGIYQNLCPSSTNQCDRQTKQYQNAMTLGIAFFQLPLFFIGFLIDKYGCRSAKLASIIFHIIGWLSLALVQPSRDYLIYLHCVFSSISGSVILISSFASANYFSKSRALISALLTGAVISATMWFSLFQKLIDDAHLQLSTLAYIWLSFGLLMFLTSFLFLDWKFSFLNLPYQFDMDLESNEEVNEDSVWRHLRSPLYILVVLFLSILLLPSVFLSVVWEPWITHIAEEDKSLANKYTFIYTISTASAILICPINGYLLGFRAVKSTQQKLLNISIVESTSWLFNVTLCIIAMFLSSSIVIPVIINCFARSTIIAGCQAVISTFFPSKYIGRLTGIMWTTAGAIVFIQFGLIKLTADITKAWKAWVIILSLVLIMSSHLVQIWIKYFRERKKKSTAGNEQMTEF